MPRYFTLQQAERLLPEVETAVRDAMALKAEYQRANDEWQNFSRRVTMAGGMRVDHSQVLDQKRRRETSALDLKATIEKIDDYGCVIKDLDIGLIDFPTLFRGEEVYLCWKVGEAGIKFWHGTNEGFRGRKPIDKDFLAQHKGE